ncbi:MAG: NAD(P)/FAD-dependent oxidoreductase [Gemmatimonadales bacterium]
MPSTRYEHVSTLVLGAGVTGLAAGVASSGIVLERKRVAGGICSSYYMAPKGEGHGAYRFEYGGGHWIFGGRPDILEWIERRSPTRTYERLSAVYFPDRDLYVPYPLQNHLSFLGRSNAQRVLNELASNDRSAFPVTMSEWLMSTFGPTLCELFFFPFHEAYTAGLYTRIAPQDPGKSPVDLARVREGARQTNPPAAGYNVHFRYPLHGLDRLVGTMVRDCDVRLGNAVTAISPESRKVTVSDGGIFGYRRLVATLPLHQILALAGIDAGCPPDPYTSVLVLNIGGIAGPRCPDHHWLYVPESQSGFHRVGFYSNVDASFLPPTADAGSRVSIYVEKAFLAENRPEGEELEKYQRAVVQELQDWGYLLEPEVMDPTWVDVAYTWSWPGSDWRAKAVAQLEASGIEPVGRYARWHFQGIADSIRDGLAITQGA